MLCTRPRYILSYSIAHLTEGTTNETMSRRTSHDIALFLSIVSLTRSQSIGTSRSIFSGVPSLRSKPNDAASDASLGLSALPYQKKGLSK